MQAYFILFFCLSAVSLGNCLKCYKCKNQRNMADCLANGVETCTGHQDACFREEKELYRRYGPRVVSAGCGKSWHSANGCDDYTGKKRCTKWCTSNLCNGRRVKLSKIDAKGSTSGIIYSIFNIFWPIFLSAIAYFV